MTSKPEKPDSARVLADLILTTLRPALRSYLSDSACIINPFGTLIYAWAKVLLAELDKREGGQP